MVVTKKIRLQTKGNCDIQDITSQVTQALKDSGLEKGTVTLFVCHSTAALSTVEFEPGLVHDLKAFFERAAPQDMEYRHNERWGDNNGHAHVRSSLIGTSLVVPFVEKSLLLGTWQQIVLLDFDIHPRTREVIAQIMGE